MITTDTDQFTWGPCTCCCESVSHCRNILFFPHRPKFLQCSWWARIPQAARKCPGGRADGGPRRVPQHRPRQQRRAASQSRPSLCKMRVWPRKLTPDKINANPQIPWWNQSRWKKNCSIHNGFDDLLTEFQTGIYSCPRVISTGVCLSNACLIISKTRWKLSSFPGNQINPSCFEVTFSLQIDLKTYIWIEDSNLRACIFCILKLR